jgi:hypothetical protein
MAVWIKWGANFTPNREIAEYIRKRARLAATKGHDVFITSGNAGTHLPYSKHYINDAVDDFEGQIVVSPRGMRDRNAATKEFRKLAGKGFDIIVKLSHTHSEWDPK